MENVFAGEDYAGFLAKIRSVADTTELGLIGIDKEAASYLLALLVSLGHRQADILGELHALLILAWKIS